MQMIKRITWDNITRTHHYVFNAHIMRALKHVRLLCRLKRFNVSKAFVMHPINVLSCQCLALTSILFYQCQFFSTTLPLYKTLASIQPHQRLFNRLVLRQSLHFKLSSALSNAPSTQWALPHAKVLHQVQFSLIKGCFLNRLALIQGPRL